MNVDTCQILIFILKPAVGQSEWMTVKASGSMYGWNIVHSKYGYRFDYVGVDWLKGKVRSKLQRGVVYFVNDLVL